MHATAENFDWLRQLLYKKWDFFLKLDFETKLSRELFLIFGGAFMSWHKDPQCFFTMSFLLVLVFAIPINFLNLIRNSTGSKEL